MSKSNIDDAISQKFVLELNTALAMENAGIERLNSRIQETIFPSVKQQLNIIYKKLQNTKKGYNN